MKTKRSKRHIKSSLRLDCGGCYLDEARQLEKILAGKPARVQIELAGCFEIPSDSALLLRSIIQGRSRRTRIITNARSSLQGATVLVWLLGDTRLIRDDARLHFRAAGPFVAGDDPKAGWRDASLWAGNDLEEEDYIRVLHLINEFLPVKELAGRPIGLPVLKEYGLVDNEKVDHFLASSFRKEKPLEEKQRAKVKNRLAKEASR
jgi:hypothetical protein